MSLRTCDKWVICAHLCSISLSDYIIDIHYGLWFLLKPSWNQLYNITSWYILKQFHFCRINLLFLSSVQSTLVQSLSHVHLFAILWTTACQGSLSITNSWSLLKLMSIESVMPFTHIILSHPLSSCLQSFPESRPFQMSQVFVSGGQSVGVSASPLVLPMSIQDWFPLGWTSWISLQSKGLSRVFSYTTIQKHKFFSTQLSL